MFRLDTFVFHIGAIALRLLPPSLKPPDFQSGDRISVR